MALFQGSNGSGISTSSASFRGSIKFQGQDLCRLNPSQVVELGISQVPEGRQIFPHMTVKENLEMGAQFPRVKKLRAQTLEEIFGLFPRLQERLSQKAGTLSGGEQQSRFPTRNPGWRV